MKNMASEISDELIFDALVILKGYRNLTPKQLGRKLDIDTKTTFFLLLRLEQLGYVNNQQKMVQIELYSISEKGLGALRNHNSH